MPARGPLQDDLFATIAHAPSAAVAEGGAASRTTGQAHAGASESPPSVSIEWYAECQAELYRKGLESASAYWKASGVTWP